MKIPEICDMANLPMFESEAMLRAYYCALPAVTVKRVGVCRCCGKHHAEFTLREKDGGLSDKVPAKIEAHNRALSARDTERYQKL